MRCPDCKAGSMAINTDFFESGMMGCLLFTCRQCSWMGQLLFRLEEQFEDHFDERMIQSALYRLHGCNPGSRAPSGEFSALVTVLDRIVEET